MKIHSFYVKNGQTPDESVLPSVKNPEKTAIFLFAAPGYLERPEFFKKLQSRYPGARMVGCSTAGEIFGDAVHDDSVSVAIAEFESTQLETASVLVPSPEASYESGKELGLKLLDRGLVGVFLLLDGIKGNPSSLLEGLNSVLPRGVTVTGGSAADGTAFKTAWVIKDGVPTTGAACALGLYGENVLFENGIWGGWYPFGPERTVTRCKGNIVYEFDGQPALELYKKYLGDKAAGLPATGLNFPLRIRPGGDQGEYLRGILNVDEAQQSITCAGDVPQGAKAQLMGASIDQLIDGDPNAKVFQNRSKDPALAIAISCVGRRLVLGQRTDEEPVASLEKLPEGTKQVGFYAYGEVAPGAAGGSGQLHNQTMTLTVIQERQAR